MLPNLVTGSRLVAVVLLLVAAALGLGRACLAIIAYALFTDAIDGPLARALGQATTRGAQLDSIADCALYLTAPVVALLLFPWLRATDMTTLLVVLAAYALPVAYGVVKFRRLTSYHTTAAKVAGVTISLTFFLLVATRIAWPFRIATAVLVLSAIEEMCITFMLPGWRANVPSLRSVFRKSGLASGRRSAPSP
jgi:cardiolipin synthase